jgi:hypothetical protein
MEVSDIIRLLFVMTGVALIVITILSLARRKITETISMAWGLFALVLILAGIFLRPTEVAHYVSKMGLTLILAAGLCIIVGLYFISLQVSVLTRKNQELAMQVSLLNQENEQILKSLKKLQDEREKWEGNENEKTAVCD